METVEMTFNLANLKDNILQTYIENSLEGETLEEYAWRMINLWVEDRL